MIEKIDIFLQKIKLIFNKYKAIILVMLFFSILFFFIQYLKNDKDIINVKEYYEEELEVFDKNKKEGDSKIAVYITGQINKPGVYYIEEESRLDDLIKEAGGVKEEANIDNINLAKKLSDGEKINIYKIGEEIKENIDNNFVEENGKININQANSEKLQTLTGIGKSTASKIIEYRKKHGNFKSIEELKNVNGIGDSKFNSIKNDVCI